ncbi:hypothetical protein HMPREF1624_08154 [Sporothrix schenckii ATCC 58251]|uniref:SRR1-like domain-containing protein n=1 Tax=Sporothrix schenckii (strain ATCC 58251 / de Perez 2211183) TaxID=1391915 RepID=U7PJ17_SPOS1|nr:hypothetical protein HMPREF1624_08154 [Sporothrix schenckii ATCC 58251]
MPEGPSFTAGRNDPSDAPWVTVPAKGGRRRGRQAVERAINSHDPPEQPPGRSSGTIRDTSMVTASGVDSGVPTHVRAEHERVAAWWREQPSCMNLRDLIETHSPSHAAVTRAVCLGAGSFGGPLDFGESIRRAHIQTEAFLLIVEELSTGHAIECFFQEPLYTSADKAYLIGLGHTVIETPAAYQMIGPTTMVFAIHLPTREYLGCLLDAVPVMLIGTGYETYEDRLPQFLMGDSGALGHLRHIHNTYQRFRFPCEKHDHCFSDTFIYWRPLRMNI